MSLSPPSAVSVKLWFWSSVVVEGAVGMDGNLGEFARPRGDQAPVPWPPFHPNYLPFTQPHLSLLGLLWRAATCLKPVATEDS